MQDEKKEDEWRAHHDDSNNFIKNSRNFVQNCYNEIERMRFPK